MVCRFWMSDMRVMPVAFMFLVFLSCQISDVTVAKEPVSGEYAPKSPYMPKPWSFEDVKEKELYQWLEVHTKKGLLGYIRICSADYFDPEKKREWYMVYDKELNCIGYITELGRTFRFFFNDYKEETEYIGTYSYNEALEHLFGIAETVDLILCDYHANNPTEPLPLVSPIHYETLKRVKGTKKK